MEEEWSGEAWRGVAGRWTRVVRGKKGALVGLLVVDVGRRGVCGKMQCNALPRMQEIAHGICLHGDQTRDGTKVMFVGLVVEVGEEGKRKIQAIRCSFLPRISDPCTCRQEGSFTPISPRHTLLS